MTRVHTGWSDVTEKAVVLSTGWVVEPEQTSNRGTTSRRYQTPQRTSTHGTRGLVSHPHMVTVPQGEGFRPVAGGFSEARGEFASVQPVSRIGIGLGDLANLRRQWKKERMHTFVTQSEWGKPCEDMFFHLAQAGSPILLELIQSGYLKDTQLTFALEAAGHLPDRLGVVSVLASFLDHPASYVREGAVYGLNRHLGNPKVQELLQTRREVEESPGVREAIEEALEGESDL